jgi:hypothetical protein
MTGSPCLLAMKQEHILLKHEETATLCYFAIRREILQGNENMLPRKESILTGFGIINFLILSSR